MSSDRFHKGERKKSRNDVVEIRTRDQKTTDLEASDSTNNVARSIVLISYRGVGTPDASQGLLLGGGMGARVHAPPLDRFFRFLLELLLDCSACRLKGPFGVTEVHSTVGFTDAQPHIFTGQK
jgi:hypothetical protein